MKKILVFLVLLLSSVPVYAEDVEADLSVREIEVSVGFTGSKVLVFGATKKKAEVVIVIEGPPVRAKLWTKKRKMGFWVNERPMTFEKVPGFYAIASSKPFGKMVQPETAAQHGLTLKALFAPYAAPEGAFAPEDFEGLKQAQRNRGLYQESPEGVRVTKGGLFRADFTLPSAVPIGPYKTRIYLLREGKVISVQESPLLISRIGLEASINHLAHESPFLYVLLALGASIGLGGGGAFLLRRRS
jgi:uncharacterized protein (TIGR02186 family)